MGRLKKVGGTIISVVGTLAGLLLLAPWRALDWIGRIMDRTRLIRYL